MSIIIVNMFINIEWLLDMKSIAKNSQTKVVTNKCINLSCLNRSNDSLIWFLSVIFHFSISLIVWFSKSTIQLFLFFIVLKWYKMGKSIIWIVYEYFIKVKDFFMKECLINYVKSFRVSVACS